jgi:hypothetical protein
MKFKQRTLAEIATMICGSGEGHFQYRTSRQLDVFFQDADVNASQYPGLGYSRVRWTEAVLQDAQAAASPSSAVLPGPLARIIGLLMEQEDAQDEPPDRPGAIAQLNNALKREGLEAFYGADQKCHLRRMTRTGSVISPSPHRPFTAAEVEKRERLAKYLDRISEDELIEEVLLPLFRQLGFHRITPAGHKDKALEYGKDIWMRFRLPTQHYLYFGVQVKKGKLDAAGVTKPGNANVAEVHHQALMMLANDIFDPETGKQVLVDHAFIVAGGEITKQARNWIGRALDAAKRSQIMFIERDDILNLYVVANLPLPKAAQPPPPADPWAEPPF